MFPKISTVFTDMQTKTIFHRLNTSYNTGVAVQDNAAQQ